MKGRAVTEAYEQRMWEELNALLAETAPADGGPEAAERAYFLAISGHDAEIADLYWKVRRLSGIERGYLRNRLDEDNPVAAISRRLAGSQA